MTYRERIIHRLTCAAVAAQNRGEWDRADALLILALRWESHWDSQEVA